MWIESHQSLATHRKLLQLRTLLKICDAQAIGHLHLLWWWCLDNAPQGELGSMCSEIIAEAAHWRGDDANAFVSAMIKSGFIDKEGTRLSIHDWKDFTYKLIEAREKAKERMRLLRERSANVTRTSSERDAHVQGTVPDHTVPKEKSKKVNGDANCSEVSPRIDPQKTGAYLTELRAAAGN